ncbi:hypothetical protein [Microbacterium sp. GXF7504]
MGIFSKRIDRHYGAAPSVALASPWAPDTDALQSWAIDDALRGALSEHSELMTRDLALRIPAVKRAHALHVGQFARIPLVQMNDATPTPEQPKWLTNSASGVSPYHRMYGVGSDLFFYGWALLGFTKDRTDCMHVPWGMWEVDEDLRITIDAQIDTKYHATPVAIPAGYGDNGILIDGIDTLREARAIERAYMDRLDNPVPLTILSVDQAVWETWSSTERDEFRKKWIANRSAAGGATAMKPDSITVEMPGQIAVDLYESGRNAVRLDIANHTSTPASLLEGTRQAGGGGTEIRYSGVQNGANRSELWDYGKARDFLHAVEARLSLDDVCDPGLSIRGDISNFVTVPTPPMNPTSED